MATTHPATSGQDYLRRRKEGNSRLSGSIGADRVDMGVGSDTGTDVVWEVCLPIVRAGIEVVVAVVCGRTTRRGEPDV